MNEVHENGKIDIDQKLREAEAYKTHGLFSESLGIYEEIRSVSAELDPKLLKDIEEKIQQLKSEIDTVEQDDLEVSSDALSILKEAWTPEETTDGILGSALGLKELGLFKEAMEEYKKLFDLKCPMDQIIPGLAECLFKVHSPSRAIDQIEKIISEIDLSDSNKADAYFMVGMELEKQEHGDLALELYESVKKLDPEYKGLDAKIESAQSSRAYDSKYDYLLENKLVTTQQLQNSLALSKKMNKSVEFILMDQMRVEKEDIGKSLSFFYKCRFMAHDPEMSTPYELLTNLKQKFLVRNSWVPLSWEISTGVVEVYIDEPHDLSKTDNVRTLIQAKKINYTIGIREDIEATIKQFYEGKTSSEEATTDDAGDDYDMIPDIEFEEEVDDDEEIEELDESSSQVVRMVDQILISAYRKGASDIHIEPSPLTKKTVVRLRIDGVCQEVLHIPVTTARAMMSRLKILSNLDIAERRLPQDGKIKFKRKGVKTFELRLATIPTVGGYEDAVLRILAESGAMKLDNMGLIERNLEITKHSISQPYGLFLVVGPTGSGKTTTLHSALGHINVPGTKIWTAEDPVEITQIGLRQVQCQAKIGLDFARVMRAFLRADPDVIMIGEMRDEETASIGVEASLTGHLVFSTLHTNSAPETVTRLLDMGLNPLNFSDAFLAVLAQRLARRICKKCKQEYQPSEDDIEEIKKVYGPKDFDDSPLEITPETVLYRGEGCDDCNATGYKGRLGIHELMEGTAEIKRMIKKEATAEDLFIQAMKEGMTTLQQDGIIKTFDGITDVQEIRRVCVS
ncbi:MAG: Flp pilus assembly complex ATPase component TadA [Deltaproteobacteria bacterium]|nr:Flp pilus assembly complex ATPase component TadA [Deltaproteobacteria bacterium]